MHAAKWKSSFTQDLGASHILYASRRLGGEPKNVVGWGVTKCKRKKESKEEIKKKIDYVRDLCK